jgi:dTDP-4-amino-4,6-dideoxygalactose transaminase
MDGFHLDIPFNRPYTTGRELKYIQEAVDGLQLSGNGPFGARCEDWLQQRTQARRAMLTPSCTAALELAALLLDVVPGDEIIMPSFTFPSTATAFVLRGATPVFVDIREDTLNIDETLVEGAVTERTRAVVPVHYAGVSAELDALRKIADRHDLAVVEDAAQALASTYHGRPVGRDGDYAAISFHETKNVMCGEGGALLLNVEDAAPRAEIIREKGTDRARLFRGEVDKYTWRDVGSSFLLSEMNAAFLWAQLEQADEITTERLKVWQAYDAAFADLDGGLARRPVVPEHCAHNAHMYYLLLADRPARDWLIQELRREGIVALFHFLPLHTSEAGLRFGKAGSELPVTSWASERVVRLPLWIGMGEDEIGRVVGAVTKALTSRERPIGVGAR